MSIENDLGRIAAGIETMTKMMGMLIDQKQEALNQPVPAVGVAPAVEEPVKTRKPRAKNPASVEELKDEAPAGPAPAAPVKQYDHAGLRAIAQKIALGFNGDTVKLGRFTEYVRVNVCGDYSVQRLSEIPEKFINQAAQALIDYAKGDGINVG